MYIEAEYAHPFSPLAAQVSAGNLVGHTMRIPVIVITQVGRS
jgi:hypothetical protein